MNNELISIITPCYNAARFISQTIESVQKQTYKNWEMIIVDDCSTDNSEQIVKHYSENDKRIRFVKLDSNSGSPAAPRNRAIQEARGSILAFLDADDLWKPDKLEVQLNILLNNNYDIVYSNGEMVDEGNRYIRTIKKTECVDYVRTLKHDELSCSSVMLKKSLIDGFSFEKQMMEDYIFWLQVLRKTGAKAWNVNKVLYSYRLVNNSRSRDKKKIIKRQWYVLRHIENLNTVYALYCFVNYIWINLKKYYLSK